MGFINSYNNEYKFNLGGLPIEDVYYPFNLKVNLNVSSSNNWEFIQNHFEDTTNKFVLNT